MEGIRNRWEELGGIKRCWESQGPQVGYGYVKILKRSCFLIIYLNINASIDIISNSLQGVCFTAVHCPILSFNLSFKVTSSVS